MITATAGDVLLMGITDENVRRLKDGQPIRCDFESRGINISDIKKVVIFHGKDMDSLMEQVKPFLGPETRVMGREN